MREIFDDDSEATISIDEEGRVCGISHLDAHCVCEENTSQGAALAYIRRFAGLLKVPEDRLTNLHQAVSYLEPGDHPVQYRLSAEKMSPDSTTIEFRQTALNIPVWNAGMTVTMKHGPYRVIGAEHTGHDLPVAKLPPQETVDRYLRLFALAEAERATRKAELDRARLVEEVETAPGFETGAFVRGLLARDGRSDAPSEYTDRARLIRGRFYVYRFDPEARLPKHPEATLDCKSGDTTAAPLLPLAPVPPSIKPGQYYVVAETTFEYRSSPLKSMAWRALVELESGAVLYLRPLAAGVTGMVFKVDPITASGDITKTPDKSNEKLNPLRTSVVLANLSAPIAGIQFLKGTHAKVSHRDGPMVPSPIKPAGSDFDFDVRTNDFAAVNAYYHVDRFFETLESLGFSRATYFKNTVFPLATDHRGRYPDGDGIELGAYCYGDGMDGVDHVSFALNDLTNTTNPVGRACDSRAIWHELGGHGTLLEQIGVPNFDFAHSAGDSLSAIFHDPTSNAPDRKNLRPWHPTNTMRCDRDVAGGWAWGGIKDDKGYGSEEILATTLFRVYESIGGDPTADPARRLFASRMMLRLIFQTIYDLAPTSNPQTPENFAKRLMEADQKNWTSEGVFGGAYSKVIRWSFEKQGLFQAPGTPGPIAGPGLPPDVDVYIDDGRGGEYQYEPVHWDTPAIWNRLAADGMTAHQAPVPGQTNFAYVKVKNRGTKVATNVQVKGFHCKASAGLLWPNDFQPMTTAQIAVGSIAANNTQQKIVGPFQWVPVANGGGHDSLLMVVSATQDQSNIATFQPGDVIEDWRLVPNDNNIALRSMS